MVTQATREKTFQWAEHFGAATEASGGAPAWVARMREEAFARFRELDFPTTDEEDYKYTNVAPVARGRFAPASADDAARVSAEDVAPHAYEESRRSRLVFVNGFYRPDLSSLGALPRGVVALELNDALAGEHAGLLRARLARAADYSNDSFAALNTALFRGGAFLYLPPEALVEAPIHLLFLTEAGEGQTPAVFPRVLVEAGRGSSATLVESFTSAGAEGGYFTDAVSELFVGESARLTHYKVQRESDAAFHVASTQAEVERAGGYDLTTITLGARLSRHNVSVRLTAEGSECWVDGLYLVGTGQHADTHSLIDHRQPRCTSRQTYKGILDGKSRAVFNGRVFVRENAPGTDAQQSNKNLLLSSDARVDTKPQLEIFNDDVKCAHGATVGQLEEEELFYLASRGLHPELARNLLTYGFAEEIVEKVRLSSIKSQLDEAILNRLHARLEA